MTVQPTTQARGKKWPTRGHVLAIFLMAALGVTAVSASIPLRPAAAAPTDLAVSASPSRLGVQVGGSAQRINFSVRNNGAAPAERVRAVITVPLTDQGVTIKHGTDGCQIGGNRLRCDIGQLAPRRSVNLFVQLAPPGSGGPAAGSSTQGQGSVAVGFGDRDSNRNNDNAGFTVTLAGPAQPTGVASVAGVIKDSKNDKPIANAAVEVTDSADTKRTARTNNSGQYAIRGSADEPIKPGALEVVVTVRGYEKKTYQGSGDEGEAVKVNLLLVKKSKKSPSPSPSPTKSEAPAPAAAEDEGSGWGMWLLAILGTLLVLGGIGALVYPFVRRRREGDEEEADEHSRYGPHPAHARGAHHDGPYGARDPYGPQHTAVLGAPGAGEPTSVYRTHGASVDEPTSMINRADLHRPVRGPSHGPDEPTRHHGGYGQHGDHGGHSTPAYDSGHGSDPGYQNDLGYPSRGQQGSYAGARPEPGHPAEPPGGGHHVGRHSPGSPHGEPGQHGGYGQHREPGPGPGEPRSHGRSRPSPRRPDRRLDWADE